jgi:uncharacterized protein YabN with tetrapyrrole methylase and pyrophosphatase domain
MDIDPVDALQRTNDKFVRRFRAMEIQAQDALIDLGDLQLEELESWWKQAKKSEM